MVGASFGRTIVASVFWGRRYLILIGYIEYLSSVGILYPNPSNSLSKLGYSSFSFLKSITPFLSANSNKALLCAGIATSTYSIATATPFL